VGLFCFISGENETLQEIVKDNYLSGFILTGVGRLMAVKIIRRSEHCRLRPIVAVILFFAELNLSFEMNFRQKKDMSG
jgi:hypothetical protein